VFLAAGAIAFGAGCLARSRYERDCLVTEEYRIVSEKIHGPEKTIVFLTDLHNKEFGDQNCQAAGCGPEGEAGCRFIRRGRDGCKKRKF